MGLVKYQYIIDTENTSYKDADLYFNNTQSIFVYDRANKSNTSMSNKGLSVHFGSQDTQGIQYYRNHTKKTIILRSPKTLFDSYTVNDTWIPIDWKIKKRFKKIGPYRCQKAVGTFRGRTYTVWFTEAIPLPYGPWKLFGLPGLILEAEDSEKMYRIKFKGIQYPYKGTFAIKKPTATKVKTLREYVKFIDNFHYNIYIRMKSKMPRKMAKNLKFIPNNNGRKYRDEKIFEWETKE